MIRDNPALWIGMVPIAVLNRYRSMNTFLAAKEGLNLIPSDSASHARQTVRQGGREAAGRILASRPPPRTTTSGEEEEEDLRYGAIIRIPPPRNWIPMITKLMMMMMMMMMEINATVR
jgi:hypothetical protein